ncbi:hypothetical protein EIP86_009724 [Pleurotus ostreatoroseus]|nr:hypothetical protein EIP86_009724 [Pleurotus ostreatoroseus]
MTKCKNSATSHTNKKARVSQAEQSPSNMSTHSSSVAPSPPASPPIANPLSNSWRAVVRNEEEENALYADAKVIEVSFEVESSDEEPEPEDMHAELDISYDAFSEDLDAIDLKELEQIELTDEDEDEDNIDGWLNSQDDLSEDEREDLQKVMQPIKLVLAKLYKLSYTILNSSTRLLSAWKKLLEVLKLAVQVMPRDVATR